MTPALAASRWYPPHYWRDEITGNLAASVARYLRGDTLDDVDVALLRSYSRQWIWSPVWDENPHHDERSRGVLRFLRSSVNDVVNLRSFAIWHDLATRNGYDPL